MDRSDDTLFAELREMRPEPRPEFTAELDQRAATGFPRRESPSAAAMPFARLAGRWRALSPRRRLVPALGFAFAVLAVATVVVATIGNGGSADLMTSSTSAESGEASGGGAVEARAATGRHPRVSQNAKAGAKPGASTSNETRSAGAGAGIEVEEEVGGIEEPPAEEEGTEHAGEEVLKAESDTNETLVPLAESAAIPSLTPFPLHSHALKAPGFAAHRDIERSASVVLGTKPGEVAGAASKVYEAVHAVHGIVLHSSVQSGSNGATGASFELLIPSGKLDDALAAFSQIAEVRERHDATNDITKPTVGAAEELADSNAAIESLLKELGDSETETEREAVEARLREERSRHAAIKGSLEHLHKRASRSEVSVRIVTDRGAGVTPPAAKSGGSGDWSVGDALHDAGHILTVAAGVLLIALAVLAPIALILLLVWLANRFRVRRLRERTLG